MKSNLDVESNNFDNLCCICYDVNKICNYKCIQCNNTYICLDCKKDDRDNILKNCPVCRKYMPWFNIKTNKKDNTLNKIDIIINQDNTLINNFLNKMCNFICYFTYFIIIIFFSYIMGYIIRLLIHRCINCGMDYINILYSIFYGIIFLISIFIISLCLSSIIDYFQYNNDRENNTS